jgi:hypothetical protein
MAKWADYLISGVWKVNNEITNVVLHTDSDDSVGRGSKASEAHVISLIERGFTVKTIRWNYSSASWNVGASVIVVQGQYRKFLRTVADAQTSDNLDNMLPMGSLT